MLRVATLLGQMADSKDVNTNPAERLEALVDYIAENYVEGDGNSLDAVISAGRKKILESIIYKREVGGLDNKDPNLFSNNSVYEDKGNFLMGFFVEHPRDAVQYLLVKEKQKALKAGNNEKAEKVQHALEGIENRRYEYQNFEAFGKGARQNDMINLEEKYNGKEGLKNAFTAAKPGFWEKTFGRTSDEWKNFKEAYAEYRHENPQSRNVFARSASMYLEHKLPGYDSKNGLPNIEDINRLSGKSKERALLCYNALKSVQESKEFEKKAQQLKDMTENAMKKDGTQFAVDKIFDVNSINPADIHETLKDESPIETITSLKGDVRKDELTEKQKDFQKDLAADIEDEKITFDEQFKQISNNFKEEIEENSIDDMSIGD